MPISQITVAASENQSQRFPSSFARLLIKLNHRSRQSPPSRLYSSSTSTCPAMIQLKTLPSSSSGASVENSTKTTRYPVENSTETARYLVENNGISWEHDLHHHQAWVLLCLLSFLCLFFFFWYGSTQRAIDTWQFLQFLPCFILSLLLFNH